MTEAKGPTNFSNTGEDVIKREIAVQSIHHDDTTLLTLYEIERTVNYIQRYHYKKVALQFPNEMLADAASVSRLLKERTSDNNVSYFILADTSYGSCCVDEVAAQHVNADAIVHYGHSCLSPTSYLPVLYVFGYQSVDLEDCIGQFKNLIPDHQQPVILMSNVEYSHIIEPLKNELSKDYQYIISSYVQKENDIKRKKGNHHDNSRGCQSNDKDGDLLSCKKCQNCDHEKTPKDQPTKNVDNDQDKKGNENENDNNNINNNNGSSRSYILPNGITIDQCIIFFIGKEGLTLTNIMMVHNQCQIYTYNPLLKEGRKETISVNKMLMKRYFMVQKAKDANTIGIVVGTLGVGETKI
ncbi:unnamed protein product [Cunninghamella blakesleeana]